MDVYVQGAASGSTEVVGDLLSSDITIDLASVALPGSTLLSGSVNVTKDLAGEAIGEASSVAELTSDRYGHAELINRNPEPGEIDVPVSTDVAFDLTAVTGSGTFSGVNVYVNEIPAVVAGVFQPGWDGPDSTDFDVGTNALSHRFVIDPTVDFGSTEAIEVCIEATITIGADSYPFEDCYTFTTEDLTAPTVLDVMAIELDQIRVTFSEPVSDTAIEVANYAIAAVLDPDLLQCVAGVEPDSVARVDESTIVITADVELSHGRIYTLTIDNIEDVNGNAIASTDENFVAFEPTQPEDRDFDLWGWIPETNRREDTDGSGDLRRWICVLQETTDLLLFSIDRWVQILDVDLAPERFVDAMLADLGNPFDFVLSLTDKRRLARVLVEIYRQKGLARGIKNVIRFFMGIEVEILPYEADGAELGVSELGFDWILGSSSQRDLYTFNVESPIVLTDEEQRRILQIVDYMKPAHTHLGELVEPETPEVFDHWELGVSELGETTLLH